MRRIGCSLGLSVILGLLALPVTQTLAAPAVASAPTLLLVILDGARWDITKTNSMPNLARLARSGVQGEMIPVWPTISSPNHWAIASGLYPIHGGPYTNDMYDPVAKAPFDRAKDSWSHGEPIWTTVTRQGGISGVVGEWIGSQMKEGFRRPSFSIPYQIDCANCARLALSLLDQDADTRPNFLALYVAQPDHVQHLYGVDSPQAKAAIAKIDAMFGILIDGLERRGLLDSVNIVVVSDHGQINRGENEPTLYLEDVIDVRDLFVPPEDARIFIPIWPKAGKEEQIYEHLRQAAGPHFHVYKSSQLPARLHCCDPTRAPPIILTADPGWTWRVSRVHEAEPPGLHGIHGYDNTVRGMHALFIAAGPSVLSGRTIAPFDTVDVYPFMAALMHITPALSDGTIGPLCQTLVSKSAECKTAK